MYDCLVCLTFFSTFKKNCPARLKFKLTADGQHLVVTEAVEDHNHTVSEIAFQHLPKQRKLEEQELEEAKSLLRLKANKKMVQEHLINKTGKFVLLRDLSNIRSKNRNVVLNPFFGITTWFNRGNFA